MIEYYKNFSFENLFYIDEKGLVCQEEWRDVVGYEEMYQVSNLGRVKSLKRMVIRKNGFPFSVRETVLKQWTTHQGYLAVTFWRGSVNENITTNKVVAEAFFKVKLQGSKLVADHIKNNQRKNNTLSNLQIISARLNVSKDKTNKSSKYTGVCFNKVNRNWQVNIKIDKPHTYHLGAFYNEEDAGRAYQLGVENLLLFDGSIKNFRNLIKSILQKEKQ